MTFRQRWLYFCCWVWCLEKDLLHTTHHHTHTRMHIMISLHTELVSWKTNKRTAFYVYSEWLQFISDKSKTNIFFCTQLKSRRLSSCTWVLHHGLLHSGTYQVKPNWPHHIILRDMATLCSLTFGSTWLIRALSIEGVSAFNTKLLSQMWTGSAFFCSAS